MDAATIREMNKMRKAMGMKPLPVPEDTPMSTEVHPAKEGEKGENTIKSRAAQAYDNFRKKQDAEEAEMRRKTKAAAAKKAREKAQRFALLEGKGLAEDYGDELDAKAWVLGLDKRRKKNEKRRKAEEEREAAEKAAAAAKEYTSKDLAGVRIAHDVTTIVDGDEQILTLKDTTIEENEADGDELENIDLREHEQLKERLELKRKQPGYNPHDDQEDGGERNLLSQYDEEIFGKRKKQFTLGDDGDAPGTTAEDSRDNVAPGEDHRRINLDMVLGDDAPVTSSDYLDVSEVKFKKVKRRVKSTRKRTADDEALFPDPSPEPEADAAMDIDNGPMKKRKRDSAHDKIQDDEDLQISLSISRLNALKKRKKKPEDFAKQLLEDRERAESEHTKQDDEIDGGLVISDMSMFLSGLQKPDEEEEAKPHKPTTTPAQDDSVTAMEVDSDNESDMESGDDNKHLRRTNDDGAAPEENGGGSGGPRTTTALDEEQTFDGFGSTVSFLRSRKLMEEMNGAERNRQLLLKGEFLRKKKKLEEEISEQCEKDKDRDRANGRLANMSVREREEYQRQKNEYWQFQLSRQTARLWDTLKPVVVDLKYTDDLGRSLDQKEAFKALSHQFHGRGSGKGKTDKHLKKVKDEKRREARSILDANQNAGMSSATAHQTKKRREAGVRLA